MTPTSIPLAPLLHTLAQALLYPVLALLLLGTLFLAYQAGLFCAEWRTFGRRGGAAARLERLADQARRAADPPLAAERLLANEELSLARRVERTDLLVRLGPALGLAGTLIPLGPGLAALGRGDARALAEALSISFDTTIFGVLIGAAAFVLSTVRRRWFDTYLVRAAAYLEDELTAHAPRASFPPAEPISTLDAQ